jgi:hypothetical protein
LSGVELKARNRHENLQSSASSTHLDYRSEKQHPLSKNIARPRALIHRLSRSTTRCTDVIIERTGSSYDLYMTLGQTNQRSSTLSPRKIILALYETT